jgi:hypothetical protein
MLVADSSTGFEPHLSHYLDLIDEYSGNKPSKLLFCNKSDLLQDQAVPQSLIDFSHLVEGQVVLGSARSGLNVALAFERLVAAALGGRLERGLGQAGGAELRGWGRGRGRGRGRGWCWG